jgi:hypothetical protein
MAREHRRDWGFWIWTAAGLTLFLGFFVMPVVFWAAVIGAGVLAARGPRWPAPLGLIAGLGLACLVIAYFTAAEHDPAAVGWALAGAALAASPALAFWWLRCRPAS